MSNSNLYGRAVVRRAITLLIFTLVITSGIFYAIRVGAGGGDVDTTFDTTFDTRVGANSNVLAFATQPDGKVIVGGFFTRVNGVTRTRIARLLNDPMTTADNLVIRGFVHTPDGTPLSGITVTLTGSAQQTTRTDTDGEFVFTDVANGGIYVVSVNARGYRFNERRFSLGAITADATLDFTAHRLKQRSLRSR